MGVSDERQSPLLLPWEIVRYTSCFPQRHGTLLFTALDQMDLVDPAGPGVLDWCVKGFWIHH